MLGGWREDVEQKGGFALCGDEHSLKGPEEDELVGFPRYRAARIKVCPLCVELGDCGRKVGFWGSSQVKEACELRVKRGCDLSCKFVLEGLPDLIFVLF